MSLNPDDTVTCPYNKAHTIILSRLQFHIEKCRIQHPNAEKATCPFNATHIINKVEMPFHLEWCQERIIGEREFFKIGGDSKVTPAPAITPDAVPFTGDEVWGEEAVCTNSSVLDQIREEAQHKPVLVNKICAPKSVRKQHKLNERRRFAAVVDNKNETLAGRNGPLSNADIGFCHQSEEKTSSRTPKQKQEVRAHVNLGPVTQGEKLQDEGKKHGNPWQGWKNVGATGLEESLEKIQMHEKSSSIASLPQRDRSNPWRTNQPPPVSSDNANAVDFPVLPVSGRGKRILH